MSIFNHLLSQAQIISMVPGISTDGLCFLVSRDQLEELKHVFAEQRFQKTGITVQKKLQLYGIEIRSRDETEPPYKIEKQTVRCLECRRVMELTYPMGALVEGVSLNCSCGYVTPWEQALVIRGRK